MTNGVAASSECLTRSLATRAGILTELGSPKTQETRSIHTG